MGLVSRVGLNTVSGRIVSTILDVIANLVEIQRTISQLSRIISGERERCVVRYLNIIALNAGCAQGHATQQRRRGGDAGEKFPHLHENPLFLIV